MRTITLSLVLFVMNFAFAANQALPAAMSMTEALAIARKVMRDNKHPLAEYATDVVVAGPKDDDKDWHFHFRCKSYAPDCGYFVIVDSQSGASKLEGAGP